MKRKTAKELLVESFTELAEHKPIDKITIREITDNCGYSPATFYRQFKDKYDLVAWDYTRGHSEIMNRLLHKDYEWRKTLLDGAYHFYERREYLANLLLNTNGADSFARYMKELHFDSLRSCVLASSGLETLDEKLEMYIRLYCQGTVELTCDWILGKYNASPEELAEVYEYSLPSPLRPYLYKEE